VAGAGRPRSTAWTKPRPRRWPAPASPPTAR
jgi:hypothetical protein